MSETNWTRPSGPPIVWKKNRRCRKDERWYNVKGAIINTRHTGHSSLWITDCHRNFSANFFSVYEDALDHMCQYFLADEVTCKCLHIIRDQNAVDDSRLFWKYILRQGMSIGAFKLEPNGELGELVGMNVLYVSTAKLEKSIHQFTMNSRSRGLQKIFTFLRDTSAKVDIRRDYGVDKYLAAMGLSVKPTFRGQKIGVHLLEVRKYIGLRYGITVTSTIFLGSTAQLQAEQSGFETKLTVRFDEVLDADGYPMFPNIEAKELKLMVKNLM